MRKIALLYLFVVGNYAGYSQVFVFGDSSGFSIRKPVVELYTGTHEVDLDCDGVNDLNFEVLYTAETGLRRTAINLLFSNGLFDIAVFETGKVKNFAYLDTIQCLPPDLWTNFEFLVIGISGPGGYFGNCCFDQEYIGFRKRTPADTLLGWIKISSAFFPVPKIQIEELALQGSCTTGVSEKTNQFKLFPNPSTGVIFLQLPGPAPAGMLLRLIDATGRPVLEQAAVPGYEQQILDMGQLSRGLYFLQAATEERVLVLAKVVLE